MQFSRVLFLAGILAAVPLAGAEVRPLSLADGANSSFADDKADDREGGWTDQGSNDLRLLPPGRQMFGGVPFDIITGGKSCVVLSASKQRDYLPKQAEVKLPASETGKTLYLLHAGAWLNSQKNLVGRLTVKYADGSSKEFRVRTGRDIADWWGNSGVSNAQRVWTVYNNNSQVSLYASKFQLDDKPVVSLLFTAGDDGVWMIAGGAIGDSITVKPIQTVWKRRGNYPAPDRVDAETLASHSREGVPKNIILIIGDGMGQGAVKYAGLAAHGATQTLVMERLPVRGMAYTFSANSAVTDSAASGTALSSGYKTNNGMLGMNPDKVMFHSFAEEARDAGRKVGIITSDALTGATPGAQYAHVPARGLAPEIAEYALASRFDVLIGSNASPFLPKGRKDGRDLTGEFQKKGYVMIDGLKSLEAAGGKPVFGFLSGWDKDTKLLSQISAEAFKRLESPGGFYVMIEGHYPDYGGHGNNPDLSLNGTLMVDFTVKAALDFAAKRNDTLIVVTADHETGGLFCAPNPVDPRHPVIGYSTKSHTGSPVDVFAYGPGADHFAGLIDNTDIPAAMAKLWQLPLNQPVR